MIQNGISNIVAQNPCIPVVTFKHTDEVKPVLDKLAQQKINCIEITLRTDVAEAAIRLCQSLAPEHFKVGVGTIIEAQQVELCQKLAVDFMVSPGSSPFIVDCMQQSGIAFLPGVMTPSEIIRAHSANCQYLKLFPFNIAGGIKAIKSYAKVFPSIQFCPTGGVDKANYQSLLALDNVVCVGGSWLIK